MNSNICILLILCFQYTLSAQVPIDELSNVEIIKTHLSSITKTNNSRSYQNIETLNEVASYIYKELEKYCDTVYYQPYTVKEKEYKNVIGVFGKKLSERLVIGAHYDVAGNQEGADDNASGVTGILELSRLLSKDSLRTRIDLVAYTLEEPPFFRTKEMGSYIHAKSLIDKKAVVKGMICLEMIGFFSEKENSQLFPDFRMAQLYGNRGDFITIVGKKSDKKFTPMFVSNMKKQELIRTQTFLTSSDTMTIDFSDHLNYWNFGFNAIMITDTAMFRNKNYHRSSDTMETLDMKRMKAVIDQLYLTVRSL